MIKPYKIVYNDKGDATLIMDTRVSSSEDVASVEKSFLDGGYEVRDVTEEEFKREVNLLGHEMNR